MMESGETLLIIGWVIEEGPFHFWSEQCFGYGNRLDRCGEGEYLFVNYEKFILTTFLMFLPSPSWISTNPELKLGS